MATIDFDNLPLFPASVDEEDEVLIKDVSSSQFYRVLVSNLIVTPDAALSTHENNVNNPHNVTKVQIGLGNLTNDLQLKVSANLSDLSNTAIALNNLGGVPISQFNAHATNVSNPHGVTAAQTGAYSISQVNSLLNGKAPLTHVTDLANPHAVTASQVGNVTAQWNANQIQSIPVDVTALGDGKVLAYNSVSSKIEFQTVVGGTGINSLDEASDTIFGFLTDGDLIVYSTAASAFLNLSPTSAGLADLSVFNAHVNASNPHNVTATTIGLENVLNETQLVASNNLSDLLLVSEARTNLGMGTLALQDSDSVSITGGTIDGVTASFSSPLPISSGGTGESTALEALTALGGVPLSVVGAANGVASLGSNAKIPASQIPDIDKGQTLIPASGIIQIPVTEKRSFRITLTENTTLVNPLVLNQLADEYFLYIEQDGVGGRTLSFDPNFILMNFPPGFAMPLAPAAYIHVVLKKIVGSFSYYVWLEDLSSGKFVASVGDGTSTSFLLTHNFNTRFVVVKVFASSAPYAEVDSSVVTAEHTSVNEITLNFVSPPTSNQYNVVIIS